MKADKQQTILIVDDESMNFKILSTVLKDKYRVLVSKNGEQALKIIAGDKIDLVLLDIVMPDMDGYEVLRRIKNMESAHEIPVIFTTSKQEAIEEAKGLQLGAVDYIRKPFFLPIVEARVQTHLDLKLKNDILTEFASLDGLTNIFNRRKFDKRLAKEWKRASRNNTPLSLLMIDVDYFKRYNDNYGHAAGDACLKDLCTAFKDCLRRPEDFLARYGGEEFCAILPNINFEGCQYIAAQILESVQGLQIKHEFSSVSEYVSVSVGGATKLLEDQCKSSDELLMKADQMLYMAKECGRNMYNIYEFNSAVKKSGEL